MRFPKKNNTASLIRFIQHPFILFVLVFFLFSCAENKQENEVTPDTLSTNTQPKKTNGITLSVGSISDRINDEINNMQPFITFLVERLKPYGVAAGRPVVARTKDEMVALFEKGEVDIYIDSPFPTLYISLNAGTVPFLKHQIRGYNLYKSLIFTRKDSGVEKLDDLKGNIIALDNPFSTSGYFVPVTMLKMKGYQLYECENIDEDVPGNKIGYIFSKDDENTMFWVVKGKVLAGATDNINFMKNSGDKAEELLILEESFLMPRQLVSKRANLDDKLVEGIEKALTDMHNTIRGRKVLSEFHQSTGFVSYSVEEWENLKEKILPYYNE